MFSMPMAQLCWRAQLSLVAITASLQAASRLEHINSVKHVLKKELEVG
jgi:predicted lipoprotein